MLQYSKNIGDIFFFDRLGGLQPASYTIYIHGLYNIDLVNLPWPKNLAYNINILGG